MSNAIMAEYELKIKLPPMVDYIPQLTKSFNYCKQLMKSHSNFYIALLFTPKEKRDAICAIYAWLHAIDEIVDSNESQKSRAEHLVGFYDKTLTILSNDFDPLNTNEPTFWPAFKKTIDTYSIPKTDLEKMIAGQEQDLVKHIYHSFAELQDYAEKVASSVGLMLTRIWGFEDQQATIKIAKDCGIAFQLTNVLRDYYEDLTKNRVYLPTDYFHLQDPTVKKIKALSEDQLILGFQQMIDTTRLYYRRAFELWRHINKDSRLSFFLMFFAYYTIFAKFMNSPERLVRGEKINLSTFDKLAIITKAIYQNFKVK